MSVEPAVPRPDAAFVAQRRAAEPREPDEKGFDILGRIDQRPTEEHLKQLAQTLAAHEQKHPTMATLPGGGIVYQAPQITAAGSPFLKDLFKASFFRFACSHRNATQVALTWPCRSCLKMCCGFEVRSVLNDDEHWRCMLGTGLKAEKCPERLRGLFWMQVRCPPAPPPKVSLKD